MRIHYRKPCHRGVQTVEDLGSLADVYETSLTDPDTENDIKEEIETNADAIFKAYFGNDDDDSSGFLKGIIVAHMLGFI